MTTITGVALFAAEACSGGRLRSATSSARNDGPSTVIVAAPTGPRMPKPRAERAAERERAMGYLRFSDQPLQYKPEPESIRYFPTP